MSSTGAQVCHSRWLLALAFVLLPCDILAKPSHAPTTTHKDPYPWHLKACVHEWDCDSKPNTRCIDHLCKCEHGYELDLHSMRCVKNKHCEYNFECGDNSFCHQGRCHCHLGYVPNKDDKNCYQKKCFDNSDCYQWINTKCGYFGYCTCKDNYYQGWNSQSCQKSENNYSYNFLAQNVFTIVIISNFLLWLSIFIFILQYAKRRRLAANAAAAESAAAASMGRRALPPGLPPPPPAYDNIGFDPITYPAPPPYTPTDADKVDTPDQIGATNTNETQPSTTEVPPSTSNTTTAPVTADQPISHIIQ